jgi:hypothetical protein
MFIEALNHRGRPKSHLVMVPDVWSSDSEITSESEDEPDPDIFDIGCEDVYVIQGWRYDAYAADKTEKRITANRKEGPGGSISPHSKTIR